MQFHVLKEMFPYSEVLCQYNTRQNKIQKCMCFCKLQKQLGSVDTNTIEDEFQREDECSSAYEFKIGPHYVTFYDDTFPIPLPAPVELSISKFS